MDSPATLGLNYKIIHNAWHLANNAISALEMCRRKILRVFPDFQALRLP